MERMELRRALLLVLVMASPVMAQSITTRGVILKDEGTVQGSVSSLDCVGTGIACTRSGATGTLTITGGSGGANLVAVVVDFGANGLDVAATAVTGQAWATGTSLILCAPTMYATADRIDGAEDAVLEGLTIGVSGRTSGGFTVTAAPRMGVAIGKYTIVCTGA